LLLLLFDDQTTKIVPPLFIGCGLEQAAIPLDILTASEFAPGLAVTEQCAAKCEYDLTLLSGGGGIFS
jgi:hypothetical protein